MNSLRGTRQRQDLRESDELFRLLVDGVKDYAIFVLDPNGLVASWNTGAQKIKGYEASEIVGTHFSRFYTPEDLARNWPERELEEARAKGRFEDEGWRVRKDGTRFWANVVITALYDDERRVIGFAKVTRNLTDRRRLEAMQETGRQMNEFLAMLGHELRNPLAAIVNAIDVLRIGHGETQVEAQDVIDRQAVHLIRIVDDLLDISRITRGKVTLKREALDLNDLVARTVNSLRSAIEARGHDIDLQLSGDNILVLADSTRLSQVVVNLVGNAVKYTPTEGRIEISTECERFDAVIRVRDDGIGMSAELVPTVFDLFVQGNASMDRAQGGLGIGLTLVKRLTELQGGSVQASSGGLGKGSEFVVRLPLALDDRVARGRVEERIRGLQAAPRRLLIVDDNVDALNTLATLLTVMGHDVRTANDGTTAIAVAEEFRPDAIFLDIGLPGMNGFDVARKIRDSSNIGDTRLIAFTGYGQEEDRRRVREAGFDHHLVKPTPAAELTKIIDDLPVSGSAGLHSPG